MSRVLQNYPPDETRGISPISPQLANALLNLRHDTRPKMTKDNAGIKVRLMMERSMSSDIAKVFVILNSNTDYLKELLPELGDNRIQKKRMGSMKIARPGKVAKVKKATKPSTDLKNTQIAIQTKYASKMRKVKSEFEYVLSHCPPSESLIKWVTTRSATTLPSKKGTVKEATHLFASCLEFWRETRSKDITVDVFPIEEFKTLIRYGFFLNSPCYRLLRDMIYQLALNLRVEDLGGRSWKESPIQGEPRK